MEKISLNLDFKLSITDVLKLGHFLPFSFPAYYKVPDPSTNAPLTRPQKDTDTWDGPNPPLDKYICEYILLKKIILLHIISDRAQKCVAGYILNSLHPLGTLKKCNIPILNINQIIFIIPT